MELPPLNIRISFESPKERSFRSLPYSVQCSLIERAKKLGVDPIDLHRYEQPILDTVYHPEVLCSVILENCTDAVQKPLLTEGECDMAKHRMRTCIGYNTDGTPIIKQISGDSELELADKIVNTILASTRRQEFLGTKSIEIVPSSPPFKKYAEEWMETYKIGKCKPTTISGYNSILNQYLYPEFGSLTMDQFTTKCIQRFLNEHKDASAKYLREMKNLLSQILECAKRDGHLSDNPARDPRISIPSARKKERSALTLEQLNEILPVLEQLQGTAQLYLALAIYTGMRRGEVLGLRWEDIDLSENVIHVVRNVTYVNNQPIVGTPKTQSGTRDVPIMPPLLKYLLPLKDDGYLIQNTRNKENPITLTMFKTMFKHIQNASDLNGATSHTFRHTLGTLLNDAGADVKTIQGILGQKDYKTTMDRYVHPVEKRKHEAVNKIGDMLSVSV